MYDHIGLRVKDVKAAVHFYQATLEPLGYVLDDSGTGLGPRGQPGLWLHAGSQPGGGAHIAFRATARTITPLFSSIRTATTSRRCA
jgi:catechol 2,3-dioxygenase-like lactoylglutathione lyase family enzyme